MAQQTKAKPIPIIDLFAGPGGLGEGFTALLDNDRNRRFKIALSIEMDEFAHQTLTLRSFVRQFDPGKLPDEYYQYLRGEIGSRDELYKLFPNEAEKAKAEAWKTELGKTPDEEVDLRVREALKGEKNFIVIGGPPCQAYSLVGRARRQQFEGLNKEDKRVFLYREYYRILAVHNPPVFVMENVKGLLSSKLDSQLIFKQLTYDLKNPVESYKKLNGKDRLPYICPGYDLYSLVIPASAILTDNSPDFQPSDFIIRAEEYGIPQTRHRVIILGVRRDINVTPRQLIKHPDLVPINKLLSGLPRLRSGISKDQDNKPAWVQTISSFINTDAHKEIQPEVAREIENTVSNISAPQRDRGSLYLNASVSIGYRQDWFLDSRINGVCNHETRSHIKQDLFRYLFAAAFAKVKKRSPKLSDFPASLLPHHLNVNSGISENKFADRFRVQVNDQPSKTVTSHISKDGHYFIHPDTTQCRSLTVREAARIQTFPDNYYFCGPRTEQYKQVGNAVPPLLALQIAEIVYKVMLPTSQIP